MTSKATEQDLDTADATEAAAEPGTDAIEKPAEAKAEAKAEAEEKAEAKADKPAEAKAAPEKPEPEKPAVTRTDAEKPEPEKPAAAKTDAEKPEPEKPAAAKTRDFALGPLLTRAMVLVALAAAIITAVLQWQEADRRAEADATRQEIRTTAAQFGKALLSYDHAKLSEARKKVLSMAADDFAKTYDVAFTGGLEGVISKMQADATATVRNVYLNEVDGSNAKAVVVMDSEVHSTAGTRRVLGSYLEMTLVKQRGRWLISDVSSIGAINESMTNPDGSTSNGTDPGTGTGTIPGTGTDPSGK